MLDYQSNVRGQLTPSPRHRAGDDQIKFTLELGVDGVNYPGRVCAVEAGPFSTKLEAEAYALYAQGQSPKDLIDQYEKVGYGVSLYDIAEWDIETTFPIVGATLNYYTDESGTVGNRDLY